MNQFLYVWWPLIVWDIVMLGEMLGTMLAHWEADWKQRRQRTK